MAEKPILFSGSMVKAVIKGSKTQTRRVRNLDEINADPDTWHFCGLNGFGNAVFTKDEISYFEVKNPYGDKGDRLWVREAFNIGWLDGGKVLYRADGGSAKEAGYPSEPVYKPSSHMPRWASRLTLEITQVRAERVKDISRDDEIAEGMTCDQFPDLWEQINGKRGFGWDKNPWVWAISFRKVEAHAH